MSHLRLGLALLLLALCSLSATGRAEAPQKLDATPRLGILIPKGPPDYALMLDALQNPKELVDGPFTYRTGTISGVPVVLCIQPMPGEVLRAMVALTMIHDFNIRVMLYPGTSGGHLPRGQMAIGDIVLGAKNVDHGNYYLDPNGNIEAGEFKAEQPGTTQYGPLYADPKLLSLLACSARRVAQATEVPAWMEPVTADHRPQIFYFGIQGSSTIWSDNKAYTEATMRVFHEIDEDGDWYSNMASTLYKVPFLEVSVISNSIFAFSGRSHGTPATPPGAIGSHPFAQRLSNRITLDLIAHFGAQMLASTYTEPLQSPFPEENFQSPKNPRRLLDGCK